MAEQKIRRRNFPQHNRAPLAFGKISDVLATKNSHSQLDLPVVHVDDPIGE